MVVRATYTMVVRARQYRNPSHLNSDNSQCCDCPRVFGVCIGAFCECDNSFIFCLRHSGTREDNNATNCPLGRYTTGLILNNDDDFNFDELENSSIGVMTFHGNQWPVSLCGWVYKITVCNLCCSYKSQT